MSAAEDLSEEDLEKVLSSLSEDEWTQVYNQMLVESPCLFGQDLLNMHIGDLLLEWEELLLNNDRLAILAARYHGKSAFFSYLYPIWRAWSDPGNEVYIFSKTLDQAMEFIDIIVYGKANLPGLYDHPQLSWMVPETRGKGTTVKRQDVKFTNGSRIRASGYGKKIRGAHPKYVICDDVLNDEDMYSEIQREKHIEYFRSAIVNMPPPDGQVCVVGTPYHIADLYGWLKENERYIFRRYPGILTDDEGEEYALFPELWTLTDLYKKKQEIGAVAFAREIHCQPVTDDIAIFPSYLFPPLYDRNITLRPSLATIEARELEVAMGVDLAISSSVGADYFVIFIQGRDPEGFRYIIDLYREKGLPYRHQLKKIQLMAERYEPGMIFIESNLFQKIYSDDLRRETDLPIKPFETKATNKYPLDKGIPSLRILLENEKIIIPRGDAYSKKKTTEWINEATQFGFVEGKLQGIGEHDDTVMAWWMCEEATKAGGFSFSTGEEFEGDEEDEMMGGDVDWEAELLGSPEEQEGEEELSI